MLRGFRNNSVLNTERETISLGKKIAQYIIKNNLLKKGCVIALQGELGSGKTCLTKGIAFGLGIKETITSPTYTIINEYLIKEKRKEKREKRKEIKNLYFYHVDAYRLNNENEFIDIGGQEILSSGGICAIEWSDRIQNLLPGDTITISLTITGETQRSAQIKGIEIP